MNEKNKNLSNIESVNFKKFEAQCEFLQKNFKYKLKETSQNFTNPESISITFDDGRKEIIQNALPIILKYKIPILVFICPQLVGLEGYLDMDDLIRLQKTGLVEFGAHGFRHIPYNNIPLHEFILDVQKLKKWFIKSFNFDCKFYSHPFGSFNKEMLDFLRKENLFDYVFCSYFETFDIKNFDNLKVPRIQIWNYDNMDTFRHKLEGSWNWAKNFISYGS